MSALKNVFVVAAKRSPFGAFGGKLKGWLFSHTLDWSSLSVGGAASSSVCVCVWVSG
jgi:hypothetical protein